MDKEPTQASDKKRKKTKGPIRFEAIIPVTVIVLLIFFYFRFFFDAHLKKGIEWGATYVHGAEVNVGSVRTDFLAPSFTMRNIQITDKNQPERNLFQVGRVHFGLLWDALLRAKVVVEDAAIEDIRALTPRSRPGRLRPPRPSTEGDGLKEVQDQVLAQAKEDYNDNLLGDVAALLGGVDPRDQLKNLEDNLKTNVRIKELEVELKAKQQAWEERIQALPQGEEIKALGDRLKTLNFNLNNPSEFAKSVQQADTIIKEADQKVRLVTDTGRDLQEDINTYNQAIQDLDKMIQQDLKDLQARLNIPNIDGGDFTKRLFMNMIADKLASVRKYAEVAQEYMPAKKSDADSAKELVPPPRGEGRNYQFPITKGYPTFWLKKARIQSEVSQSEYSGNIEGEITNLTTHPPVVGKPAIFQMAGDFPRQQIHGFSTRIVIDHTTETPKQSLDLKIASYPVGSQRISDSEDVRFIINQSTGELNLSSILENQELQLNLNNNFKDLQYNLEAKNKIVNEILNNVVAGIPIITVNARVTGSWQKLNMHLNSNLGDELSKGIRRELEAKIRQAQAQVRQAIEEKVGGEKAKLTQEFNKIKSQIDNALGRKKSEVESAQQSAKNQLEAEKQKAGGGQLKELEEQGKELLKNIRFGR